MPSCRSTGWVTSSLDSVSRTFTSAGRLGHDRAAASQIERHEGRLEHAPATPPSAGAVGKSRVGSDQPRDAAASAAASSTVMRPRASAMVPADSSDFRARLTVGRVVPAIEAMSSWVTGMTGGSPP